MKMGIDVIPLTHARTTPCLTFVLRKYRSLPQSLFNLSSLPPLPLCLSLSYICMEEAYLCLQGLHRPRYRATVNAAFLELRERQNHNALLAHLHNVLQHFKRFRPNLLSKMADYLLAERSFKKCSKEWGDALK